MSIFNKITYSFLLVLFILNTAYAQRSDGEGRRGDPTERANQQTDRMIEALDLSAAQGTKIRALNLEYAEKMVAARKEAREAGDREAMRASMQAMRKEQNEQLKKYLTGEQVTKWEKILAERPQRERGERGERGQRKGKKEKKNNNNR